MNGFLIVYIVSFIFSFLLLIISGIARQKLLTLGDILSSLCLSSFPLFGIVFGLGNLIGLLKLDEIIIWEAKSWKKYEK
jgi:hypothetical protein